MNTAERRKTTIGRVRQSLRTIPILSKNVDMVRLKLQGPELKVKHETSSISSICTTNEEPQREGLHSMNDEAFESLYQLGRKIGEGSNGLVRECLHLKKMKVYACKSFMFDDENVPYLKKTFITVRGLNSPSFIRYKALYIDSIKHLAYLIMEKVCFPNLLTFIRSHGSIN